MNLNEDFINNLPDPKEKESIQNPEALLIALSESFNSKYKDRIFASVLSSGGYQDDKRITFGYTLVLIFLRHDEYTYPLIKVDCLNADGLFPVTVNSHYSPPVGYGEISNPEGFITVLNEILKEQKTRNIILSMF